MISKIAILIGLLLLLLNLYSIVDSYFIIKNTPPNQCGMIYLFYIMVQMLNLIVCLPLLTAILIWFKKQPAHLVKPAILLMLLNLVLVLVGWLLLK